MTKEQLEDFAAQLSDDLEAGFEDAYDLLIEILERIEYYPDLEPLNG